jgi:uncharacterized protein YbaA (DUF1428 family)
MNERDPERAEALPAAGAKGEKKMKGYVDGYILAVPKKNLAAYRQMAKIGAKVWKKYGALDYFEGTGDDLESKWASIKFPQIVKAKPGEVVVFSFIVFKSRAHRDRVNALVMKDPLMNDPKLKEKPMPFDMKRMAYGGFKVLVES